MKPIIGVITRPDHLESGNKVDVLYTNIRTCIVKYGGIPLVITPPTATIYDGKTKEETNTLKEEQYKDIIPILKLCDGFVFQGGDQFYDYDLRIVDYAYLHDIPSLGICLGMQLMSCSRNGILQSHIENDCHYSKCNYFHDIILEPNSKLASILRCQNITVNSRHHEQILATDLNVVAHSKDGVIEAVEDPKKKFFIGVQWHPEDMIAYDEVANILWKNFILVCEECADENKRINRSNRRNIIK